MDYHLVFSIFTLCVSVATLAYAVKNSRRMKRLRASVRMVDAWNTAHTIGTWIALEYEPSDPVDPTKGRVATRTSSNAYLKDDKPVVDVEHFGTIDLDHRVFKI